MSSFKTKLPSPVSVTKIWDTLPSFDNVGFHQCDLGKADFRTARGYAIDPLSNKVRNLRSSLPEAASFLPFLGIKLEP